MATGCLTPQGHREKMDRTAQGILKEKQKEALGREEEFAIERPSDILRRRLLGEQDLPITGPASLGTDQLKPIPHWPEKPNEEQNTQASTPSAIPQTISMLEALQIGARNSSDYQSRKERVFQTALALELERNEFRNIFVSQVQAGISTDSTGHRTVSETTGDGSFGVTRKLKSGPVIAGALAVDLAKLLTGDGASSLGLAGDATVSIPLLRGSGEHIVAEPLTQAERNVIYAFWEFERYKKEFAVQIASSYLQVLRQRDSYKNTEDDYRSRIASARRSRRLADAGRIKEIEVDQAVQNELQSRRRWISTGQQLQQQEDSFKRLIGLPPDARIEISGDELTALRTPAERVLEEIMHTEQSANGEKTPAADAEIVLTPPSMEGAGPLEMDPTEAVRLALANRLDLLMLLGKVYDAQREVVVAADALGAELTFFGSANLENRRDAISWEELKNARLHTDKGVYSALMTLDLPLERTPEAVNYRNSFIELEQATREVQKLEDQIKLEIRGKLRDLLETRENLRIQAQSVYLAEKRVKSVNLFLEAGRAQIRDLVEAQDDLLAAQIELTGAAVDYRIAELEIQRDMEVLQVDAQGLWQEYTPEKSDVQK